MADVADLYTALRAAHAAGDKAGAARIAGMIQAAQSQQPAAAPTAAAQPPTVAQADVPKPSSTIPDMLSGMERPVPVDDSWFPEGEPKIAGVIPHGYTIGNQLGAGFVKTMADMPNWPTRAINNAQEIADLHFGSGTGEIPPEKRWVREEIMGDSPDALFKSPFNDPEKLFPTKPGWENIAGLGAAGAPGLVFGGGKGMLAAPLALAGGNLIGDFLDTSVFPNDHHKWARTLPVAMPGAVKVAAKTIPNWMANPVTTGGATLGLTGNPTQAAINATASAGLAVAKETTKRMSWPEIAGAATAPYALDSNGEPIVNIYDVDRHDVGTWGARR